MSATKTTSSNKTHCNAPNCPARPCQVCLQPQTCSSQDSRLRTDNIGTFIVDVVGIFMFFLFLMLQFWFKVATYVIKSVRAFYTADRVVQIALGLVGIIVFGSFVVHLLVGNHCYSRGQTSNQKKIEQNKVLHTTGGYRVCKPENLIRPLKITLQSPRKYRDIPLNMTKTFTLMIFDSKKKKVFETTADVNIPESKEHPPLIMAMQPIVVYEYL